MLGNKAYRKDFILYKGSDFIYQVPLSEIYVSPITYETVTFEGGAKLKADSTKAFEITAELVENNKELKIYVVSADTEDITVSGIYKFAIDMSKNGVINTILVGEITVEEDISQIA